MKRTTSLERCFLLMRAQLLLVTAYASCAWALFSPGGYAAMMCAWPSSWLEADRTRVAHWVWGDQDGIALDFGVLTPGEQAHFEDTRQAVQRLKRVLLPLVAATVVMTIFLKRSARLLTIRCAAITALLFSGGLSLWALFGWKRFFAFAHGMLFRPGTWQFPHGAYSLILFPRAFWIEAALVWLLLPCVLLWGCVQMLARVLPEPA